MITNQKLNKTNWFLFPIYSSHRKNTHLNAFNDSLNKKLIGLLKFKTLETLGTNKTGKSSLNDNVEKTLIKN